MKSLRTIIVVLSLAASTGLYAVSSFFELSAGGGWSTLGYRLSNETQPGLSARQAGSYGLNVHAGYGLQFTRLIGVGVGVDLSRYGSASVLKGEARWTHVMDTEGEAYDHITATQGWTDQQEIYMVEVPLSLYLRFPVAQYTRLYAQAGVKACVPIMNSGQYSGKLEHQGVYEPWGLKLTDVPNHGFYHSSMEGKYDFETKITAAAFVKFGIEGAVSDNHIVWLYGAIYGTFHFMPAVTMTEMNKSIGWRNDSPDDAMRNAHSFMTDYSSILQTNMISGKTLPMAFGAEIGVRFRIPHMKVKSHKCRCEDLE